MGGRPPNPLFPLLWCPTWGPLVGGAREPGSPFLLPPPLGTPLRASGASDSCSTKLAERPTASSGSKCPRPPAPKRCSRSSRRALARPLDPRTPEIRPRSAPRLPMASPRAPRKRRTPPIGRHKNRASPRAPRKRRPPPIGRHKNRHTIRLRSRSLRPPHLEQFPPGGPPDVLGGLGATRMDNGEGIASMPPRSSPAIVGARREGRGGGGRAPPPPLAGEEGMGGGWIVSEVERS